jgi:ParB family transcriptional regulator, chromosome partitioning protein
MRKALGKGLAALIPISSPEPEALPIPTDNTTSATKVAINKIRANRYQPRKNFNQESLQELAESIREHGLAQPIIVSRDDNNDTYELIAGERRLRACELAGLNDVDVIIRPTQSDKERLALSLVENLQRENLNAVEQALGYTRLIKEFQINQTELTRVIGKSKSAISNTLRILDLPENIQKAIQSGQITEGHARALLMIENILKKQELFTKIITDKLSVRETENLARTLSEPRAEKTRKKYFPDKTADVKALETELQHLLGTKVDIKTKTDTSKGSIIIHYYSLTDFDKIIKVLKK